MLPKAGFTELCQQAFPFWLNLGLLNSDEYLLIVNHCGMSSQPSSAL